MLVLTRRPDESIVIGDGIVVTVLGIARNGQVRLGIEAPRSVPVHRLELLQEIQAANRSALPDAAAAADMQRLAAELALPPNSGHNGLRTDGDR